MRKTKSLGFASKMELFALIGGSILFFFVGSAFVLLIFWVAVLGCLWKEKVRLALGRFFDELFTF